MKNKEFMDIDTNAINAVLTERFKTMPHLEKIDNETWWISPLTQDKRLILNKNREKVGSQVKIEFINGEYWGEELDGNRILLINQHGEKVGTL